MKGFLRSKRFSAQVVQTTGWNGLLVLLAVGTGVLSARILGPEGRGELAAIQLWPMFFSGLSTLGLSESIVFFSAKEPDRTGRILVSAVSIGLVSTALFVLLGHYAIGIFLASHGERVIGPSRIYLWILFVFPLMALPHQVLRGTGEMFSWNLLRLLPGIGWLVVLCLGCALAEKAASFYSTGYLISLVVLTFPIIIAVMKKLTGLFRPDAGLVWPLLMYGLPSVLGSLPQMLNLRLDQMLMAALFSSRDLGIYVVAVTWGGASAPLLTSIGTILFPRVAASSNSEEKSRIIASGIRVGVLVSGLLSLVVLACTPYVLPWIFGWNFRESVPAAMVLVFAAGILNVNGIISEGIRGLGAPKLVLYAESGGLVSTIAALVLLLPLLGILGAAFASLIGYGTVLSFLLFRLRKLVNYTSLSLLLPTIEDIRMIRRQAEIYISDSRTI